MNTGWIPFVAPEDCDCYKCTSPKTQYIDGHRTVVNNVEHHTFGQPCEDCGNPRTEYKNLGTKGRYVCWYCTKRAASPDKGEP